MVDTLFLNGSILTMNPDTPRAEALAVRGEQILAVGSEAAVRAKLAPGFVEVDLAGRCLLPGFHDSHVHLTHHGFELSQVRLESARTLEEGLQRVAERAATTSAGEWLLGAGYLPARWGVAELHKRDLDRIAPEHPVLLRSQDHHAAWVNSKALELAGVTPDTPNPEHGEIVRDDNGEATGVLLEQALHVVMDTLAPATDAQIGEALQRAAADLSSLGITTVHHMAYEPAAYWRQLALTASRADYPLRVWACIGQAEIEQAAAIGLATGQGGKHFQVGGAKFFADGALGSLTAHMLDPYAGTRGVAVDGLEVMLERFPLAIAAGLVPVTHAIGDAANRAVLDALEASREAWQAAGLRPRIEHAQHLHPDDIARFGKLGVVASMQPLHVRFDGKRAGELLGERRQYMHAWRSLKDKGALLAFGSDTPVASPGVIEGLKTSLDRRSEEGEVVHSDQALTLTEALSAYTRDAAYTIGWEGRSGQLNAGFDADLVLLTSDPFAGLEGLEVSATMKAGRWTFTAS